MSDAKTEEPTRRRLERARQEGDVGASAYASQAVGLVVAVLVVPPAIAAVADRVGTRLREAIALASDTEPRVTFDGVRALGDVVELTLPALLAVAVAASAAQLVQTGGIVSMKRVAPRLARLNPFALPRAGAGDGLVSRDRLVAVARASIGGAIALGLVVHVLHAHLSDLARSTGRLGHVASAAASLGRTVAWNAAIAGLALAVIDVALVRALWKGRMRMSRREVERERKESEGDPLVKQARDEARQAMLAAATIAGVKNASVVITGAASFACALRHDERDEARAPVVVASGEGEHAAGILRAARDFGVPVASDASLARALEGVAIGDAIPEALYEATAQVLRDVHAG